MTHNIPVLKAHTNSRSAQRTRAFANTLTFLLWLALIVTAMVGVMLGQARVPLATEAQKALAPLAVSEDGKTVIIRHTAKDALRIRVEPAEFGRTIEFTVGDVRSGRWGQK